MKLPLVTAARAWAAILHQSGVASARSIAYKVVETYGQNFAHAVQYASFSEDEPGTYSVEFDRGRTRSISWRFADVVATLRYTDSMLCTGWHVDLYAPRGSTWWTAMIELAAQLDEQDPDFYRLRWSKIHEIASDAGVVLAADLREGDVTIAWESQPVASHTRRHFSKKFSWQVGRDEAGRFWVRDGHERDRHVALGPLSSRMDAVLLADLRVLQGRRAGLFE